MKLLLGDCYEKLKEIPDKSVDLVVIDPPYDIGNGGGKDYISQQKKQQVKNIDAFRKSFDFAIFNELERVMKKINIYIWCSKWQILPLLNYWTTRNITWELLTWHKTNAIPAVNNIYFPDTEYCIFIREKGVRIYGNSATKRKWWVTGINQIDARKWKHPTIKPLDIIENLIINSTKKEGEVVLDCFMGSGTTGVACVRLNREFIGIEIDPEYFKIAQERILGVKENKYYEQRSLFEFEEENKIE